MIMNEEYLRMRDVIGTSFALVGCFFIIQFSDQSDEILDSIKIVKHLKAWPFILYILVEVCFKDFFNRKKKTVFVVDTLFILIKVILFIVIFCYTLLSLSLR